jgi:hypothetical protein
MAIHLQADIPPLSPEAFGALSLAIRHEKLAEWPGIWHGRHGSRRRTNQRLRAKHRSKAQKLRHRAERLGWTLGMGEEPSL